jgi:hypothetical protein
MTCNSQVSPPNRRSVIPTAAPDFYALLPEFMRRVDAERGKPLAALLAAAQQQANLIDADITVLWQNFFVEICEDWVLAYIADLIDLVLIDDVSANNRREVARTIAYRRRKGTVPQLETMANDVTGWSVRVAEFFNNIHWIQKMNHLRKSDLWTVDLRDTATLRRIAGPFDRATCTADFRTATQARGRYNIPHLGFFCHRLQAIPLDRVPAPAAPAPAPAGCYHFDVLSQPEPLWYSPPPLERDAGAAWPRVDEDHVVRAIARYRWTESLAQGLPLFWNRPSGFTIFDPAENPVALSPVAADLCDWTFNVAQGDIAVDARLGRFKVNALDVPAAGEFTTNCYRGFSMPIAGGAYDRSASLSPPAPDAAQADFFHVAQSGAGGAFLTIAAALTAAAASNKSWRIVQIEDSLVYSEKLDLPDTFINLAIQAASGRRPVLEIAAATPSFGGHPDGTFLALSGLLFTGSAQFLTLPGAIDSIQFSDCTIDPGGGLSADGHTARPAGLTVRVTSPKVGGSLAFTRCILGPVDGSNKLDCLRITDCIVDATAFIDRPAIENVTTLLVQRSTMGGRVKCQVLEADLSIFRDVTQVLYRQQGCVRFSYFAPRSQTPRRYECAPALPVPVFVSSSFGDPGYMQLALDCQPAIVQGERGYEMGVWSSLRNAQRLAHLNLRLNDYMPAGLVPEFIFAT